MLLNCVPEEVGVSPKRLERAFALLKGWVDDGTAPGVSALVARRGRVVGRFFGGFARLENTPSAVGRDTIFAVASVTKPVTAAALMLLVERGSVSLDQPVQSIIPEFSGPGKEGITVRQLAVHTSGLPERLPDNEELRLRLAGLDDFVRGFCRGEPMFPPGSRFSYSNYGYGLMGEIIRRIGGRSYADFVQEELLRPLGMKDSFLKPPEPLWERIAFVHQLPDSPSDHQHYNSAYSRRMGPPWSGLYTTPEDIAVFGQYFLDGGKSGGGTILSPAATRVMTRDHAGGVPGGFPSDPFQRQSTDPFLWRSVSWGIGFDVKGMKTPHYFGELTSPAAFGHIGATGSMFWVDPETGLLCVLFVNRALDSGWSREAAPRQALFSNAVAASVEA
jgi:beta-lactamase class C